MCQYLIAYSTMLLNTFARAARRALSPRRTFTASARFGAAEKDTTPTSEDGAGLGSASPWSTFDAWGADEVRTFDPEQVRFFHQRTETPERF
jgi:hypothetical protein